MGGCSKGDLAIMMTDFRDSFADIVGIYWFIQNETRIQMCKSEKRETGPEKKNAQ
jgi:hypothetical protein